MRIASNKKNGHPNAIELERYYYKQNDKETV